MLDAEVKTRFVLIPERDMVLHCGAQPGEDAHEQQVHCNNMQPRFIHAFFTALAVPVIFKFCRNQLPINNPTTKPEFRIWKICVIPRRN